MKADAKRNRSLLLKSLLFGIGSWSVSFAVMAVLLHYQTPATGDAPTPAWLTAMRLLVVPPAALGDVYFISGIGILIFMGLGIAMHCMAWAIVLAVSRKLARTE